MLQNLWNDFQSALGFGPDSENFSAVQTVLRTILIYVVTLIIIRLGSKRFLSKASAFDIIVAIMLGSVMSRGINGSTPILGTVIAGIVLIGMHWLFGILAFHTDWFGDLVKGERVLLIKDGKIQEEGMRRGSITKHDLAQAMRTQTKQTDPAKIKSAYLECNGEISLVPFEDKPRIVDVSVEDGVKTVRIELD